MARVAVGMLVAQRPWPEMGHINQPKNDRFPAAKLVQALNEFCSKIPPNTRCPIEVRNEAYLADPGFEILKKHGIGSVCSLSDRWVRANLNEHLTEVLAFE